MGSLAPFRQSPVMEPQGPAVAADTSQSGPALEGPTRSQHARPRRPGRGLTPCTGTKGPGK